MPRETQTYFRAPIARGLKDGAKAVDREKKIINGFAVVTGGVEALGHGLFIDSDFLDSVVRVGNTSGLKSRFGHPGMCSDAMGTLLGTATNLYRDGDVVRGDLELSPAASVSPSGNLAEYVMTLAESNPNEFGASIVFKRDGEAMAEFEKKNSNGNEFKSPDPRNKKNLRHARLSELRAVDTVDEPAANPGGFFSNADELAGVAEMGLEYLLGLSDVVPEAVFGSMEPTRAKEFVTSFLQRHGLSLNGARPQSGARKESAMTDAEKAAAREEFSAAEKVRTKSINDAFPTDPAFANRMITGGKTLLESKAEYADVLGKKNAEQAAEIEKLKAAPKVEAKPVTKPGPQPIQFDGGEGQGGEPAKDFMQLSREYASAHKCSLTVAMSATASAHPDVHEAYVDASRSVKGRKIERPASK